jgi:mannose-6-phosphate isomerase-like protein (cupin superfamily)
MMTRMGDTTRRDFAVGLAALAALAGEGAAQTGAAAPAGTFGASRVIVPTMTRLANGSERWAGPNGTLVTGEAIGMHVSAVPAGTEKVALHVIHHSELLVILEGMVMYEHDGIVDEAHTGSILYVASGTNHRVWNSGAGMARYVVIQVGGDTKKV